MLIGTDFELFEGFGLHGHINRDRDSRKEGEKEGDGDGKGEGDTQGEGDRDGNGEVKGKEYVEDIGLKLRDIVTSGGYEKTEWPQVRWEFSDTVVYWRCEDEAVVQGEGEGKDVVAEKLEKVVEVEKRNGHEVVVEVQVQASKDVEGTKSD